MSFAPILNAMRLQAVRAMAGRVETRFGLVQNYNPASYTVKVLLLPENILTGSIPLASAWVGNGWGMFAAPSIGDPIAVTFFRGALNSAYAELRFYNLNNQPLPVPSGEWWLVHAKGQFVKLTNDGKLTVSDGQGATVALNGDGSITSAAIQWNHTGPMSITGDVDVTGTVAATVDVTGGGSAISLVNHKHGGVQTGSGNTGAPI